MFSTRLSSRGTYASFPIILLLLAAGLITGCGGGSSSPAPPKFSGDTAVTVVLSSAANDQLTEFDLVLQTLTLTNQAGTTVNVLTTPQGFEFIHLNGQVEPLLTVGIPQGIYTSATATIGGAQFTCLTEIPGGGLDTSTFAYGYTPNANVTVSLPSPLTITGESMGLSLDLQVLQSATYSACYDPNDLYTYSITPTFNLVPATFSSPATNPENGEVRGVDGEITTINAGADTFVVTTSEGDALPRTLLMGSGSSTLYQGVSGFSALTEGTFVDVDAAIQPNGLMATRIAVEDPSAVDVLTGPLMFVDEYEPALTMWARDQQGADFVDTHVLGGEDFSFDSAVFQISGALSNLQSLPFVPSFNGSNMVPGQNLYITSPQLVYTSNPYTELRTITLVPQAINGSIVGSSQSGSFTDYTVSLAPYDLFPQLAVQQGQNTLLSNPSLVEVYVDSNTQMLNTTALTAPNTLRFYGLVFNDNGTLRMDCAQINDGVDFTATTGANSRLEIGTARTMRRQGAGPRPQTITETRSH
jgi:hypothetical protein